MYHDCDRFIVYKMPKLRHQQETQFGEGVAQFYMDGQNIPWVLSPHPINETGHAIYYTLQQIYTAKVLLICYTLQQIYTAKVLLICYTLQQIYTAKVLLFIVMQSTMQQIYTANALPFLVMQSTTLRSRFILLRYGFFW